MGRANRYRIFLCSFFFVLGFSLIFSILGVLLQTILAHSSYQVQTWLARAGGIMIIFFGLYTVGLLDFSFLLREYKFSVSTHRSGYITSFLFGAAFAAGWTPCVSAALGAILALAATEPGSGLTLLFVYTLGIGIPFLLVGLFTNQAQRLIEKARKWLAYFQYFFGTILIFIGILIFTRELSVVADFQFLTTILTTLRVGSSAGSAIASVNVTNILVALFAGVASFLSPCVLPIVPGFLSYLATIATQKQP